MKDKKLEVSEGMIEDGIVVGNNYDKYASNNPIVKWMMAGFHSAIDEIIARATPKTIHEVGCGEGYWTIECHEQGFAVRGSDFSSKVIDVARKNCLNAGIDDDVFSIKSIYELDPEMDSADLIVCCEVLEHLDDPKAALESLKKLICNDIIISVPREPIWRVLNFIRMKYVSDFGNTPGHIQHWSKSSFERLISEHFDIVQTLTPFPWVMLHCRPKS